MVRPRQKDIERALRKASTSICHSKIAALGFNKSGVCVMARTNKPRFNREGGGNHAERLIMAEAKKRGIVRILICRIGASGIPRPIDPCSTCKKIAEKLGIIIDTVPEEEE